MFTSGLMNRLKPSDSNKFRIKYYTLIFMGGCIMGLMNDLYEFMSKADIEWAVCGGDAIDLFVGRQTRLHKDIDIAVLWESRKELIQYMIKNKWRVFEPENGLLREITCLENDYRRNHNINLENAIKITDKGIPYLAPEMVLLYKATFIMYINSSNKEDVERVKDYRHDFNVSYEFLSVEQKEWLKNALSLSYPNGHEWLQRI